MIHAVKCLPNFFEDVRSERKPFELRADDRPYEVGDYIALNEWNGEYTGRCMLVQITYALRDPQYCKDGMVALGIDPCRIKSKKNWYTDTQECVFGVPVYGLDRRKRVEGGGQPDA